MNEPFTLIPLVIGVTGHRNPAPDGVAEAERRVELLLRQLDAVTPNSPMILLSALAKGGDRIVARVALRFQRTRRDLRVGVMAVLPFGIDDYRRDFDEADDAAEFESLLACVDDWCELPRMDDARLDSNGHVQHGPSRNDHYRRLGLFIAMQSQVMVAMWDGVRNGLVGGTAEVVDVSLGQRPLGVDCGVPFRRVTLKLALPDSTPVFCIPTRRDGGPEPAAPATELAAAGLSPAALARFADFDFVNRRLMCARTGSWKPAMLKVQVSSAASQPWHRLRERFLLLDALAQESKREHERSAVLIPLSAAIGIGGFQWFSSYADSFPQHAWISLVVYTLGLLVAVGFWWYFMHRRRSEWLFVHTRALAEAMRIQLAWTGSGIEESVADLYLVRRHSEVDFLRAQFRAATLECALVHARGGTAVGTAIGEKWISEQSEYFEQSSTAMRRRTAWVGRQRMIDNVLRFLVIVFSLGLLAVSVLEVTWLPGALGKSANLGCFLVGLALALTVAFGYWRDVMLDKEDLEVGSRMRGVFARAMQLLGTEPDSRVETIRAVGREAVDEHADWFARHREKLKLPEAG